MKTFIGILALIPSAALLLINSPDGVDRKAGGHSNVEALKELFVPLFRELEDKGYWVDLVNSLELSINIMQDREILNILKEGKSSKNTIISFLNDLRKKGAAKILLTEMDVFYCQLQKKRYDHIEIILARVDTSGLKPKNDEDRLLRTMIRSGGSLERLKYNRETDDKLKGLLTKIHQSAEKKISVPCFITLAPHKKDDRHLFLANISISFYCVKSNKSDIKMLNFDLYLDRLKSNKAGRFTYPWKTHKEKRLPCWNREKKRCQKRKGVRNRFNTFPGEK